jgi:PST family polysaccharide transporter
VAIANATHVVLFTVGCLVFVPEVGIIGYGLAEVVAMPGYLLIHRQVANVFPFSYASVRAWLVGLVPPLFAVFVPFPWSIVLFLPLTVVAMWPRQRHQIREYLQYVPRRPAWMANRL